MDTQIGVLEGFLKFCLRSRWDRQALEDGKYFQDKYNLDWVSFCHLLQEERLLPLIATLLSGQTWIPEQALNTLNRGYLSTATTNTLLFQELAQVLSQMSGSGIEAIILKGAALATQVYPNIAMRPMVDLDLLVSPNNVPEIVALLQGSGYQVIRHEEQPGFTLNYENEIALLKKDTISKMIEIHWSLFNSIYYQYKIQDEWLWRNTQAITIKQVPALMLNPEAQIFHLCGHLSFHHSGKGWLWLHDLAEILHAFGGRISWESLFDSAQRLDLVIPIKNNLLAVIDIYGNIISEPVIQQLKLLTPTLPESRYFESLTRHTKTPGKTFLDDLSYLPDWRRKLHFALSNLFPSISYMKARYDLKYPIALPIYYFYRWYLGISGLIFRK
jgi:hypothetical protein